MTRLIVLLGLCLTSVLTSSCAAADIPPSTGAVSDVSLPKIVLTPLPANGSGGTFESVELSADATTLPAEALVYEVVEPNVTPQSVEKEARKFELHGLARYEGDATVVKGKGTSLAVDQRTGSINWLGSGYSNATEPITNLLSDDEYIARARDFLESKGYFDQGMVFTGFGSQRVDGKPMIVEAHFGRRLNGHAFEGVGPKKTVSFGDNGEIVGMFSVWREVRPLRRYPLMSPTLALQQINQGGASVMADEYNVAAVADSVEIVYLNDALGSAQRFVAPHYRFTGKTEGGKSFVAITRAIPFAFLEEAGERPVFETTPSGVGP